VYYTPFIFSMGKPTLYGLIGYPLEHSFSPAYFNAKFLREDIAAGYMPFPITDIGQLPALLLQHPNLWGLNVTIPYKETIIPLLDELDKDAATIGAVNCISIHNGKTKGYNTDVTGFENSLKPLLAGGMNNAIILGTGGAARAVKWVLKKLGINYISVSRQDKADAINYDELTADIIHQRKLIINTTPLGMYPHVESYPPIDYTAISDKHLLYDLVYNPELTQFLQRGKQQGAEIKNGYEMLELQAEAAWQIWTR
jgi:shikimate dehydrogenase